MHLRTGHGTTRWRWGAVAVLAMLIVSFVPTAALGEEAPAPPETPAPAGPVFALGGDFTNLLFYWGSSFLPGLPGSSTADPTLAKALLAKSEDPDQAYVWGMTKADDTLWFGTVANTLCLVIGELSSAILGHPWAHETDLWGCGFGEHGRNPLGDWKEPRIFAYDTSARSLTEKHPGTDLLGLTLGLRAAGTLGDVVFLAGPGLPGADFGDAPEAKVVTAEPDSPDGSPGINLFAFDASTGEFLGADHMPWYNDIRRFVVAGDPPALYLGVGDPYGGHVLKWRGDAEDPFVFEKVGDISNGEVADLAVHEGRLFAITWPSWTQTDGQGAPRSFAGDPREHEASLWMSPPVGIGLNDADRDSWHRVWVAGDYEPDPMIAQTYAGGALMSYDGWLYWGTMHVPGAAAIMDLRTRLVAPTNSLLPIDPGTIADFAATILGNHRATALFRGRDFGEEPIGARPVSPGEQQVVYGERCLPVHSHFLAPEAATSDGFSFCREETDEAPGAASFIGSHNWAFAPTRMDTDHLIGHSGYGNPFNAYTWSMAVYGGKLYIGTFDSGIVLTHLIPAILAEFLPGDVPLTIPDELRAAFPQLPRVASGPFEFPWTYGGDLVRLTSSSHDGISGAFESVDGLANPLNYGIRNMVSASCLYAGTANPMNKSKAGGWELIQLGSCEPQPSPGPSPGPVVVVNHPPVANDQSVTTPQDTPIAITLTGSDPDGNAITFAPGTAAHGTLTGTAPNVTYTPNAGYSGDDSFLFTVSDASLTSAPATVRITVTPIAVSPVTVVATTLAPTTTTTAPTQVLGVQLERGAAAPLAKTGAEILGLTGLGLLLLMVGFATVITVRSRREAARR